MVYSGKGMLSGEEEDKRSKNDERMRRKDKPQKMREKMVELAKEVWQPEELELVIPAEDLQIEAEAGSTVQGVFHIRNTKGRMMKGIAYIHGNTLLRLAKPDFSGTEGILPYEFCAEGLLCGEAQRCVVEVYADGGYLSAECKVQVILPYIDSSMGRLNNLMRFTELCRRNWKEALKIFRSADFERVFLKENERTRTIYKGLLRGEDSSNALEEFLLAEHRKQPVVLSAQKNSLSFSDVREAREEIIILKRSCWGYGKYTVSSDCAFLQPERTLLWTDSFVEDKFSLGIILDPQYLRRGRNTGKIILKSVTDCLEIMVEVVQELSEEQRSQAKWRRQWKETRLQLLKGFRGFVAGWLKGKGYITRQRELLSRPVIDVSEDFRKLMEIHFTFLDGERENAAELLRQLTLSGEPAMIFGEHLREEMEKKGRVSKQDAFAYACYLYLSVLLYDREEGDERVILLNYMQVLREKLPEQVGILCLYIEASLSVLGEGVKEKSSEKLAEFLLLLRGQAEKNGKAVDSSFLYVMACRIWNLRPDMFTRLDAFSVPALYFGIRQKILSKSLYSQFLYLAGSADSYHPLVFGGLCRLYRQAGSEEVLSAMLRHLIRGQQAGARFLPYFRLGVEKRLRITQLYEYFMDSMGEDDMEPLPPQALTYFQYACALPDRKKAALYANIITNKCQDTQTYLDYRSQMEKFALEQVAGHKISRNLSILYADLLNSTNMDVVFQGLAQIMFRQEITCSRREMKGLYVLYEEMEAEEYIPFINGKALVNIMTDQAVLLFEDREGGRHYNIDYTADRLFRLDDLSVKCMESNPENRLLFLSVLKKAEKKKSIDRAELFAMETALSAEGVTPEWKKKIWFALLDFYYENFNEEMLKRLLAIEFPVDTRERKRLIEMHLSADHPDKAYEILKEGEAQGILQQLPAEKLAAVARWQFLHMPQKAEEQKLLTKECYLLFYYGIAEKDQILWLLEHMEGTVSDMLAVWKHPQASAEEFQKERCLLGEKLLTHVLFSGLPLKRFHPVFVDYYQNREVYKYTEHYHLTEIIIRAYLFVYASRYLHEQEEREEEIFGIIFKELRHARMQACRFALLKYYSEKEAYTEAELSWIETNAKECIEEGEIFPFFRNFGEEVRLPSGVRNACYVSYTARPGSVVTIHYCYENAEGQGKYESQVMKERFQGIHVRSFLLFYDEKLKYYITEEQGGQEVGRTGEQVISDEKEPGGRENSFAQINMILAAKDVQDDKTMRQGMKHYIETAYAQGRLFAPFLHYGGDEWKKNC